MSATHSYLGLSPARAMTLAAGCGSPITRAIRACELCGTCWSEWTQWLGRPRPKICTVCGTPVERTASLHLRNLSGLENWRLCNRHAADLLNRLRTVEPKFDHKDDQYGDVYVDTARSMEMYREWLSMTKPTVGPGGMRRPEFLMRPVKPRRKAYRVNPQDGR